jgi:hypothetical protein
MNTCAFWAHFRSTACPPEDIDHGSTNDAVHPGEVILEGTGISDEHHIKLLDRHLWSMLKRCLLRRGLARKHSFTGGVVVLLGFACIVVVTTVLAIRLLTST